MLVAVAGSYPWATLPLLAACTAIFIASGARIAADQASLDLSLLAVLLAISIQLIPLPAGLVDQISAHAAPLQDAMALQPPGATRPLTIHVVSSRQALLLAAAAALLFLAAREIFSRGALRLFCTALIWTGATLSVVALLQHVTAPTTIYWLWSPFDAGARPFGPFINRNHFATWLILALSLAIGSLAVRIGVRMRNRHLSGVRGFATVTLSRELIGAVFATGVMLVAAAASLSRSGLIGLVAAGTAGAVLAAGGSRRRAGAIGAAISTVVLLGLGFWANGQGLADRIESTLRNPGEVSRPVIWGETLRIVGDFPVTGTGLGTFAEAMLQYQQTARYLLFNQAHNQYLHLAAEGGLLLVVPLVIFAVLLVQTARRAIRDDRSPLRLLRIAGAAGLIGVAVQSLWETGLRTPANLALAAVVAAIVVRPHGQDGD